MFYGIKMKIEAGKKTVVATVSDKKTEKAVKEVSAEKINRLLVDLFA